jgi:dipeptidyl aminopeptidase/acylaminoacyl peptidase
VNRGLAAAAATLTTLFVAMLVGCTADAPISAPGNDQASRPPSPSAPGPTGEPSSDPRVTETAQPTSPPATTSPPHPVSLPALFEKDYNGGGLRIGRRLLETDRYTEYFASYRSGNLRISARLAVPKARGPRPALVLAHGYIDPAYYVNGQGLTRERGWLANAGFIVLHTDYRNHASSDDDPRSERRLRLGYTVDVINAVHALRRTERLRVDDDRIGLLGRSMGGGVVYNALAVEPGLVGAGVVFAPVSSRTADNFNHFTRNDDDPGDDGTARYILRRYGEPRENREFWRGVSPRAYFERVTEPVLIHHGTSDDTCPLRWSRATARAMERAGVDVRLRLYRGEEHAFGPQFPLSMRRTVAFFREHL